jgi:membrane protein YqaA with SNARE-associated domain
VDDLAAYFGLFVAAFAAATILPLQSEAVLVGLLLSGYYPTASLIAVASAEHPRFDWLLGIGIERFKDRPWFPVSTERLAQAQHWYQRYGKWSLLGSWLPIIGDPLTVIAGVLKEPFWMFLILVTIAKVSRYLALRAITLSWM